MLRLIIILILIPISTSSFKYKPKERHLETIEKVYTVTLTTYSIDPEQTDSTPTITASGFIVDSINPKKHRILAVSHDLKKKFKWGSKVLIKDAGRFNGIYTVRDLMNSRWKNKIDILINPNDKNTKIRNVKLTKI
jgi:3D (Asp-Asp-Asp) domain-containing protein